MKLSIITINYNNLEGLKRTYESVVCQTWTDYEWIIIDGGSTDGSREFIEQHQDKFAYWCSEPDKGIYNAMNKGIDKARGEYLLFLNSGDFLCNKSILYRVFTLNLTSDIIAGRAIASDTKDFMRPYDADIFVQLFNGTLDHQATFIKRVVFKSLQYDEKLKIVSDWKFWIESIILRGVSCEMINIGISEQDLNGVSHNNPQIGVEHQLVLNELFSPVMLDSIMRYVRQNVFIHNAEYLYSNHLWLYRACRKIIKIVARIGKLLDKIHSCPKKCVDPRICESL